jgi:hypothetical protein
MSIKQNVLSKKKDGTKEGGYMDEIGSPLPLKDPNGGDPICPDGWKIDYDFDITDPLAPPFRCISALKDTSDSISKMMNKLNNPAGGIIDIAKRSIPRNAPAAGGSRKNILRRRRRSMRIRLSKRRKHTHRHNKK